VPLAVANNIVDRLRDLRKALGVEQQDLAGRAGVLPSQFSKWMTGKVVPPQNRLLTWARREHWPKEIFAEDGPMPSSVLVDGAVTGTGDLGDSLGRVVAPMIARDVGLAIARAIRQAQLDRTRTGIELLADILLDFAARLNDNHDEAGEIIRAVQRLRAVKI
jgi:transcriptional regulator with XRE-family HTH domain